MTGNSTRARLGCWRDRVANSRPPIVPSSWILSCRSIIAWINCSGLGGQPGTYMSTGIDRASREEKDERNGLGEDQSAAGHPLARHGSIDALGIAAGDRPGIEEQQFDVEHQKGDGHEIEADVEAALRIVDRIHAAF